LSKSDASRLHTREILTSFSLCILAISCTLWRLYSTKRCWTPAEL
jgi:hypothetical protein